MEDNERKMKGKGKEMNKNVKTTTKNEVKGRKMKKNWSLVERISEPPSNIGRGTELKKKKGK